MNDPESEDTCFVLMEKVGTSGKYQFLSLVLWCSVWFVTGLVLLGTPFLVYDPPY